MSTLSLASRTVPAVALGAGLSTTIAGAAHAAPAVLSADYHLDAPAPGIQTGDPVNLSESGLVAPPGATVTRTIDRGDGTPVVTSTAGDARPTTRGQQRAAATHRHRLPAPGGRPCGATPL